MTNIRSRKVWLSVAALAVIAIALAPNFNLASIVSSQQKKNDYLLPRLERVVD